MGRLDWDRLRRIRPLDEADVRVDPDGGHLWERSSELVSVPFAARRLRHGVIVRRKNDDVDAPAKEQDREPAAPAAEVPARSTRRLSR